MVSIDKADNGACMGSMLHCQLCSEVEVFEMMLMMEVCVEEVLLGIQAIQHVSITISVAALFECDPASVLISSVIRPWQYLILIAYH